MLVVSAVKIIVPDKSRPVGPRNAKGGRCKRESSHLAMRVPGMCGTLLENVGITQLHNMLMKE